MDLSPGIIALMGSGETAPGGGLAFETLARNFPPPLRVALLETPAGFELNSPRVVGRVGDYLKVRLQNFSPQIGIIPARRKGTPFSPDNPEILGDLLTSNLIFLGPGSPSYAVRHLADSLAWNIVQARHRLGAALAFASAATIAVGKLALPIYEIYKVGEDPHWKHGLDLLSPFGLSLIFVPHWNNTDGGDELDTSHCFIGEARFTPLLNSLDPESTLVGIDEHTTLILDLAANRCQVLGRGSVHLYRQNTVSDFAAGSLFPVSVMGSYSIPSDLRAGIRPEAWDQIEAALVQSPADLEPQPSSEVVALIQNRQEARLQKNWAESDRLRGEIARLGWVVLDTPDGPRLERAR
ncbi:MAG TPA: hypothetical protein VIO61_05145 [Anaerolineaceae bacterium]